MEPSDVGTPCRLRVARLTAWSVLERRTDLMDAHMQTAERVRQACIAAALQAYEDAGVSGLCHEGRWEYAVDAMRGLPLRPPVQALLLAAEHEDAADPGVAGIRHHGHQTTEGSARHHPVVRGSR